MEPRIVALNEKKLVGKQMEMCFAKNKTAELWQSFIPQAKSISNRVSTEFISLQEYPESFDFSPETKFVKWATVEVDSFDQVPNDIETFHLKEGLYAVFNYKGLSSNSSIYHYIFGTWLIQSDFDIDNRPHFEVLGDKYKNNDPDSEEEIWVPIKKKEPV